MKELTIERVELPTETLGSMYDDDTREMLCKTMELPWRNNTISSDPLKASCIAYGDYIFEEMPANANRPYVHYRARKVEGRTVNIYYKDMNGQPMSSILIHPITYVSGLLGCIGVGSKFVDLNSDNVPDMVESKKTLEALTRILPKVFMIHIIKKPGQ